ncbi:MAG: hypothetical protein LAP13_12515 [Acidobacteriia bacterium]|nr:hypothetical protein [Terriglobia bacterium]
MSSSSHDPLGYVILGFFGGLYYFFKGFRTFRKYRVVEDTPETRIRSIPMGLVDIQGQARGQETLLSPITRTACFLYQVNIEEWHTDSKGGGSWKHYATDLQNVKFYLEDASGKVLIDSTSAELDLPEGMKREVRSGLSHSSPSAGSAAGPAAGIAASDTDLLQYVSEAKMRHFGQMAGKVVGLVSHAGNSEHAPQRASLMQFLANPTGAGGEGFAGMMMRSMLARHDPNGETSRAALEVWKYPEDSPAFKVSLVHLAQTYARVMAKNGNGASTMNLSEMINQNPQQVVTMAALLAGSQEPQADPELEKARQTAAARAHTNLPAMIHTSTSTASGRYRLTEACLVPNGKYNITGTCTENPNPVDEHDRNMIVKGRNEPTYIISFRSHKEEEHHLEMRAALQIFGGAAASVACLAYILYRFGLF